MESNPQPDSEPRLSPGDTPDQPSESFGRRLLPRLRHEWAEAPLPVRALLVVTLPIVMLILSAVSAVLVERQEHVSEAAIRRAHQGRTAVYSIYVALLNAETGVRGYLLTRDESFLEPFRLAERAGPDAMRRLVEGATTPERRVLAERLRDQIEDRISRWQDIIELSATPAGDLSAPLAEAKTSVTEIRATLAGMLEIETSDLERLSAAREALLRRNRWIVGASVVGGAGGGLVVAWLFVAGVVQRERALRAASTETRELYEKVAGLNAALEQRLAEQATLNRELEAFSYSVSHDLRAPLRSIDGFAQALVEDCHDQLDEAGRSYLARVRAAAQRMGLLIDDMLALSRVTRSEMRVTRVDVSALAEEIARQCAEQEPGRHVTWQVAPGIHARGDRDLLRIVFENLLGNAWKFTSRTDRPVVSVIAHPAPRGYTGVAVVDNGAGFDMQYVDKLFGVFQRLHSFSEFPGTGVGLATVQRIVTRHGGRVWAEGRLGAGAAIYLVLPEA